MRVPLAPLAALTLLALVLPAAATLVPAADEDPLITYYLHSSVPAGNAETAVDLALDTFNSAQDTVGITYGDGPWMNETPPGDTASRTMATTSLGNPAYRQNFLLGYWTGEARGRVYDLTATLWITTQVETTVVATMFGDGGNGVGNPFGSAAATVPAGAAQQVVFDLGDAAANVEAQIVLSVSIESGSDAVTLLYDSSSTPSSLSFRLTEPVVEPPPEWRAAPGWGPVTLINATAAHRETSLVIDPTDPQRLFVCAPSGTPNTQYGQSFFHLSADGGATWAYEVVETASSDPRKLAFEGGDCDVAFDEAGTMYSADTWLGSLSVGHSTDDGETWTGTNLATSVPIVDRPWLVATEPGVVHLTWQDVQALMPSAIWYARSTDSGLTFTPAVLVAGVSPDGAFTWTGNFVVSPDEQDLYSVYTRRAGPATGSLDEQGPETVWVAASHDAGLTWTSHLVASMPNPASYLYPSIAMDAGGELHVVFSSMTDEDRPIWYARSTDGAQTWSEPLPVLRGVAGWSPWVAGGDAAGEAAISWYGTSDPKGNTSAIFDWYIYGARVSDGVVTEAGATTETPLFVGVSQVPEFNQVRLDAEGKMHHGASAYYKVDGSAGWALFYQREL